jgi:Hydrophobic surface binding protein A
MLFTSTLLTFLCASTTFALPSLSLFKNAKRDAATVEADINTLVSDVTALDTQIKQFDGSQASAFYFLIAYNQLVSDIQTTTSAVTASGTFSAGDSATIVNDAIPLVGNTIGALNDLIAIVSCPLLVMDRA